MEWLVFSGTTLFLRLATTRGRTEQTAAAIAGSVVPGLYDWWPLVMGDIEGVSSDIPAFPRTALPPCHEGHSGVLCYQSASE
jgi:hypothetical protein